MGGAPMRNVSTRSGCRPELHLAEAREAANHQPGAHEQHQREGDLDDDESVREPDAAEQRAHHGLRVLERVVWIRVGELPGGGEAEGDAGDEREAGDEQQHAAVDAGRAFRQRAHFPRHQAADNIVAPRAEERADHSARGGEHQALGEELPEEVACASRRAPCGSPSRGRGRTSGRAACSRH